MSTDATASDQLAIHALVSRYADAVNVADADMWAGTWTDDAAWDLGGGRRVEGKTAIVELWTAAMASFDNVIQIVAHGSVQVSGEAATGRWTLFEVDQREGEVLLIVGCYGDKYVKMGGRWSFAERSFTATYRGTLPSGAFVPFPPVV
jgi:ketosteroid isomerase-like protein